MIKLIQWFIAPLGYTIIENTDLAMDTRVNCMMQNLVMHYRENEYLSNDDFYKMGIHWDILERHDNVVPLRVVDVKV